MLFAHFKLVKMGIDLLSYITTIQLPFKLPEYPEYSNIIQIPIRIFKYQFWYSFPSLIKTLLSSENKIQLNIWLYMYFQFEIGFRHLHSVISFLVLRVFG